MHYTERTDKNPAPDAGQGERTAYILTRANGSIDSVSDCVFFAEEWARETGGSFAEVMLVDSWYEWNLPAKS